MMTLTEAIKYLTPIAESADPAMSYGEALHAVIAAAQPVPQPNREAQLESLKIAMLGTTDGGLIDMDSDIPAGEMLRLAAEWFAALPVPVEPRQIDREALARMLFGRATSNRWAEMSRDIREKWIQDAEAVIAHLSASPVEGEVEWEYEATPDWSEGIRWSGKSLEEHLSNLERYSDPLGGWWYADKENKPEKITYQVRRRRKAGPWVEVTP